MANSIFPDTASASGLVYRDATGAPTNPPNVENAYPPLPQYISTCLLTALPSDCDARIEPRQINAIVSELVAFAECIDPTGTWDCNSLQNLCTAFAGWMAAHPPSDVYVSDTPHPAPIANETLWWESDTGMLYLYYDDGSSQQWVQINAGNAVIMDNVSIVGGGVVGNPHSVGRVDCGSW